MLYTGANEHENRRPRFLEKDLIREMINRMTTGTDREKRLAAAALIEHKTKEGTTKQEGFLNLGEGEKLAYEPNRLVRWDGWLIEFKKMTLPWVEQEQRQADEQMREAQAEYDQHKVRHKEAMEMFSGLPDREKLTTIQACNIKYRQGSELARKWLLELYGANHRLSEALNSAAVAAHPNWKKTKKGHYRRIDKSQPDNFDDLIDWFQRTHPLQAREVHKAVIAELDATKEAIVGAVTYESFLLAIRDSYSPDPEHMTDRALELAADAGHVIDRDRMYFLPTEMIRDYGPDDWKLGGDDDDDPDGPEPDPPSPVGELVSS
jgi:hypothetical protein